MALDKPIQNGVPGKISLTVEALKGGDPKLKAPNGDTQAVSLSEIRKTFGGKNEGVLRDPFHGLEHYISLKQWDKEDPENTFIRIEFKFKPDKKA
jgi:hypothetical protein